MWITFNCIVTNKYSIFTTQSDSRCALKLKKMTQNQQFEENKLEIEKQLTAKNIQFIFSSFSLTSFGISIYYKINDKKVRFSDHSVSNINRLMDEVHLSLPYKYFVNGTKSFNANIL
jgi:hypothetical protein